MKLPVHTDAEKTRFRSLITEDPGIEVKAMFGSLGAFVNGNMYAGLFHPNVGVKLDPASRTELEAFEGSGPFGPEERPMGGYVSLPASFTEEQAMDWIERARRHVATFPPKVKGRGADAAG